MESTLISIVLPTYNRAEMLRDALKTLIFQETDNEFTYEIIVVDNSSTDATKSIVMQATKNCTVPIRYILEHDKGDAHARNRGVLESHGTWLAFFDDDQLAKPDWLKELYNMAVKTGAHCVGGSVHLDLPFEHIQQLGHLCRETLRELILDDKARRYRGKERPGTGNMIVARKVFDLVGLFNPSLLEGGSDHDFTIRAQLAGIDMWYAPTAIVYHRIAAERLTPEYFKWDALRVGASLAYFDFKYKGVGKIVLFCLARIGQALLINLPILLLECAMGNQDKVLGRKTLLWRAESYTRQTIALIAPKMFPQNRFFASLEFRKGRIVERRL